MTEFIKCSGRWRTRRPLKLNAMDARKITIPIRKIIEQAEAQLKEQGYETRKCGKCGSVQFKVGWRWKCIECRRGWPASQRN